MGDGLEIVSTDIRLLNLETRLPFEFGVVEMTRLPHCFVTAEVSVRGEEVVGTAADHFPPKWLTKDPDLSLQDEAEAILTTVQQACRHAESVTGASPFDCWRQVYELQRDWAASTEYPQLLWQFGVTFVERCVIDAFCRATDSSFHEAVRENELGIRPEYVYPELEGLSPSDCLPPGPSRSIAVRHTVGHGDPLRGTDDAHPDDSLPLTLVENVEAYGLDRFKIKITGDVDRDYNRVRDVLAVLDTVCDEYAFTLDANEQYASIGALRTVLKRLRECEDVDKRLLFVEQPFPRESALSSEFCEDIRAWTDRPPLIIDESDGPLDSLGRALNRGYAGVSYKNCKGVFKGMINACLAGHRRAQGESVILSGEDLTTIGPVSLQQDLAAMATVGISHAERNGHHYFRGLSMFDDTVQSAVQSGHPDLFTSLPDGTVTLNVESGRVTLDSVLAAPFGYACDVDTDRYDSPAEWSFPRLERD